MEKELIEQLSGEELDAAIAIKVMGHTLPEAWADSSVGPSHGDPGGYRMGVRPYSKAIEAAMEVVEKMRKQGWNISMNTWHEDDAIWEVEFRYDDRCWHTYADSLPFAICRCALAAIETKE